MRALLPGTDKHDRCGFLVLRFELIVVVTLLRS